MACAGAQVSALGNINACVVSDLSSLYHCCAGRMCASSTRGELRLPPLSLCSMPAVNLNPVCVQHISAQTTSPGQCIELGAEDTMYEILCSFSWEQKAKSPGGNRALAIDALRVPQHPGSPLLYRAGPSQPSASSGRGFLLTDLPGDICHPPHAQLCCQESLGAPCAAAGSTHEGKSPILLTDRGSVLCKPWNGLILSY